MIFDDFFVFFFVTRLSVYTYLNCIPLQNNWKYLDYFFKINLYRFNIRYGFAIAINTLVGDRGIPPVKLTCLNLPTIHLHLHLKNVLETCLSFVLETRTIIEQTTKN